VRVVDHAARDRAHEAFDPIAQRYLARDGVDIGRMFGSEGLRVRGKVFAFVGFDGGLILKLPEARVDEISAEGWGTRMAMRGRPMREWAVLDVAELAHWDAAVGEAFAFVDELTE
jgi:TfoX/Sxy family transcriptional regulator of competence genes